MKDIVLTELVRTCYACPSQWSGQTQDGKNFYARYRHNAWHVEIDGEIISQGSTNRTADGFCTFEELCAWAQVSGVMLLLAPGV